MFSKLILPNLERDCLNTRLLRHLNFKRVGAVLSKHFHWDEKAAISAPGWVAVHTGRIHDVPEPLLHEPFEVVECNKEEFTSNSNNQ